MDEGLALLRQGAYADALECLDLSLKFDADNPNVHAAKGCALANTVHRRPRRSSSAKASGP